MPAVKLDIRPSSQHPNSGLVYLVFVLLGMATLYPWNAFLNAYDYFSFALAGSAVEFSFMSYIASAYTGTMLFIMIGLVIFRIDQRLTVTTKAFVGLAMNLGLLSLITIFPLLDSYRGFSTFGQSTFLILILMIASCTAIGTALGMSSFYTLISIFPPRYVPAFNAGQAIAGVLVSFVAMISAAMSASANNKIIILKSTVFYFASSAFVLGLALAGFYWLSLQDMYREALENLRPQRASLAENIRSFRTSTKMIWDLAVGVMIVLTVTIAVITSYITSVKSSGTGIWAAIFLPVVFLFYNVGDVAGRWLPAFNLFTFRRRSRKPLALPWIRLLIFVPLFFMSNMRGEPSGLRAHLPTLIKFDWLYLIVVFLFGLTSGYCSTILMIIAPEQTEREFIELTEEGSEGVHAAKGTSGTIMGLFINFGLVLGSVGSFLLRLLA